MIDIGIMGHCKNDCKICYQGHTTRPNMKIEDFKSIITQSKQFVNQVALGGKGDPNLHENFEEILNFCRDYYIIPNYTTSGNGLTDEHVRLSKIHCGCVAISNYGQDFTYEALKKFMNVNMKTNIHFILSKETFEDTIKLLNGEDIWEGRVDLSKLNAVVLLLFKPQGKAKDMKELCITSEMIEEISEKIKTPKTKFKIGMDSCLVCRIRQVREFTPNEELFADTCEGTRMSCYISPDMYFMPCSFGDQEEWGVKIDKENTISKIWKESENIKRFRGMLEKDPISCPYKL